MNAKFIARKIRQSLTTYLLLHFATSIYFLISSVVWFALICWMFTGVLQVVARLDFIAVLFHVNPLTSFIGASIFFIPVILIIESHYIKIRSRQNKSSKTDLDDSVLLIQAFHHYCIHTLPFPIRYSLALIIIPASLLKSSLSILYTSLRFTRVPVNQIAQTIEFLMDWRDGIPIKLFNDLTPLSRPKKSLQTMKDLGLIHITPSPGEEIFINQSLLALWASKRIFIFPVLPQIEVFSNIFVTLNNSHHTKHWKIRAELLITIFIRFLFGAVLIALSSSLAWVLTPFFSGKIILFLTLSLFLNLLFTAMPTNHFSIHFKS